MLNSAPRKLVLRRLGRRGRQGEGVAPGCRRVAGGRGQPKAMEGKGGSLGQQLRGLRAKAWGEPGPEPTRGCGSDTRELL